MYGGEHGQAHALKAQQAVAEALVVVHHVELRAAAAQLAPGAQAERQRFRKPTGAHRGEFEEVDGVAHLAVGLERRIGPVEVEAGQTRQRSEEHTSELQSLTNLVCRLLLEKKQKTPPRI